MTTIFGRARSVYVQNIQLAITAMIMVVLVCTVGVPSANAHKNPHFQTLRGIVEGNGHAQQGYAVSLYASELGSHSKGHVLGRAKTDRDGKFNVHYRTPHGQQFVLFVIAEYGPVMLAGVVGSAHHVYDAVVVNERTTVATGTAFAQFVDGWKIHGNTYGMINAVKMAENMANPENGDIGEVLFNTPNGTETSTYPTFNSLTNVIASCVADDTNCYSLFMATTTKGGPAPTTVLQAVANIAKYPSYPGYPTDTDDPLYQLSLIDPVNQPALTSRPTSWLLFIKFNGGQHNIYDPFNLMSGPGQIAFDEGGFAWINNNYRPTFPDEIACAGQRLIKTYPWGETFPGSPYFGGGLSGAGFGIGLDPHGKVWVGNFGFEAPACADTTVDPMPDPALKIPAAHDSVSVFRPDGSPTSGFDGFTEGHIWWPQATVSDKKGNIWIANCGNDTVTFIPKGKPGHARNIAFPGGRGAEGIYAPTIPDTEPDSDAPLLKPFAIAIDPKGRAWVTANQVEYVHPGTDDPSEAIGGVYRVSSDGTVETLSNLDANNVPVLSWPMGISGDSQGNMWVSNSNSVKVPCVDPLDPQDGEQGPSITLYPADDSPPSVYTGGGLTIPWGNAVDGNDTLWVFNFGQKPTRNVDENTVWPDTPLSHFCGADPGKCPSGKGMGDPISPPTGYVSDALDRVTGGGIDPSGNVWLLNNWKKTGPYGPVYNTNPGGNSFVIVPGAAGPVKTPLIGPPQSFDQRGHRRDHRKGHRSHLPHQAYDRD
ncbi:hypothetical protein [Candidatus Nitrospira allomarina]|uniref:NHL repeat protein n=1 Tax=Candidatus Nitrospira allomarina TaxID=3020900 RepID=A0AA96GEF0_9BACT|nr:hypothetical protein [Candidatus Nitrospira allomarina]WNM57378.1 hypothetical protein PP769_15600 [Candidatus Nitrospira allomarina]